VSLRTEASTDARRPGRCGTAARQQASADPPSKLDELARLLLQDQRGVDRAFDEIDQTAITDPDLALVRIGAMTSVIGHAAVLHGGLPDKLERAVKRLRHAADLIARTAKASSFTLTVGFPPNVSVGITFPVAPPSGAP
jgi:hypothetical protein